MVFILFKFFDDTDTMLLYVSENEIVETKDDQIWVEVFGL